jgi:hypothetical protein
MSDDTEPRDQTDDGAQSVYNPLAKVNLGVSVRDALLSQPVSRMPPGRFRGAGIYAIYYTGSFKAYKRLAALNKDGGLDSPIYGGKAVPKGSRKGGLVLHPEKSTALADRLRHHADSIDAATNLKLDDFFFRYLVVDDIWIPLGETYLIERFQPVWNKVVEGFGIKTPGARRKDQYTSLWDMLHPGRAFVGRLGLPPNPKDARQIADEVERYLAMPKEEKAKVPIRDYGGPSEADTD